MSIQSEINRLNVAKDELATSITNKGVTVPSTATLSDYPALVDQIAQAAPKVTPNQIIFIDYDGTILYAYNIAQIQAMEELPPLPQRPGLICQGWNWSLSTLKSYGMPAIVGATYITDDGATRLYIKVPDNSMAGRATVALEILIGLSITGEGNVAVSWGDGSALENYEGGQYSLAHTYSVAGEYVISVLPDSNCQIALNSFTDGRNSSAAQRAMLYRVDFGRNVGTGDTTGLFEDCFNLKTVIIPQGITTLGGATFRECHSLCAIVLPKGFTTSSTYLFYRCYALSVASLPDTILELNTYFFYETPQLIISLPPSLTTLNANSLSGIPAPVIVVPNSVTFIGAIALGGGFSRLEYHFLRETPPTLDNTNAFLNISDECIIYVPAGSGSQYRNATNWSRYADQIQEEPA